MSNLHHALLLTDQYELSRRAALRYAVVTAAREGRTQQRPSARRPNPAMARRPLVISSLFWKRRWS